ncbi:MAG: hypothetical protein WDO69_08465 [Pseudomonadota bacterium]
MSNRSHVISAISGLATLAALFVSGSANAARIEGFQSRAAYWSDQPCIGNYWTGVTNTCNYTLDVQASATVTSGTYSPNAYAYGYNGSTKLNVIGISSTLDWFSGPGQVNLAGGSSSAPTWSTFASSSVSVPVGGAMLFIVTLAPNQFLSYLTY